MFFFKQKKVIVDCFVNVPMIAEQFPIQRALPAAPTWWKKLPPTYTRMSTSVSADLGISQQSPTMKFCSGFLDLHKNSWVLPLWADLIIHTFETGEYRYLTAYKTPDGTISQHYPEQFASGFTNFIHLKLLSPWYLFGGKGVNFAFIGADWELLHNYPAVRPLPGVIEYEKNHATHVNMLLPKRNAQYEFPAGLPLVYLIPLTERRVEFRTQLVTDPEFHEIRKRATTGKTTFSVRLKCPMRSSTSDD